MGHHHPLPLFLLLLLLSTVAGDDGSVILKLANSISPLPSGWSTSSSTGFCNWEGITCLSNKVTSISLKDQNLQGTLPSEISDLTRLQSLYLQNNRLSGSLPTLSNLINLQSLYVDHNNFTSLPSGFFKGLNSLQEISIGNNEFTPWELPSDLSDSTGLKNLDASNANVLGSIPDIFGSLPSLQNLRLSYNNLTGTLPPSMAGSGIQSLWLNNQQMGLTGNIDVLSNMTQLSQVWLQNNQFTGPIPNLSQCQSIFDLQLRDNAFTGLVPIVNFPLTSLRSVSLSNNKLQGPVPQFPSGVTFSNNGTNNYCASSGPCDKQVMIMLEIARGFGFPEILSDRWKGNNACDGWPNVNCDGQKNVISVNLQKQNLEGVISPAFGNLSSLRNLYLNDNNLKGSIPDSLTKLKQLLVLNVSNNNLTGKIPTFGPSVKFIFTPGNPFIGKDADTGGGSSPGSPGSSGGSKISGGIIAGIIIAVVVFVAVLLFVLFKYKKRIQKNGKAERKDNVKESGNSGYNNYIGTANEIISSSSGYESDHRMFEGGNVAVSIEVLRQVTDNFCENNIIGKGGFGVVYKGELHDGTKIAVKRMESVNMGSKGMNEFQAEIAVLTKVRHRHLVALLGYCINGNERLLVYEYMPQGTLGQHLFEWHEHGYSQLTWKQRVTIALDVARGVEYLHSLARQSFIHRDLKPSNILLGDDMRAKVADFGLVKNAPDGKHSLETRLAGTFGYLAPEYAATGRVTTKVDIYAFGVVLMEIITGRKALDDALPDEKAHLVPWFRRILISKENLPKAIDETLPQDEETLASIYKVAELAGHCTAREPHQRPDMGHAVNVLGPLVQQWRPTKQEEEEHYGIDLHISLPQALERWQADEGTTAMFNDTADVSYSLSETSIPSNMSGFSTLNSGDAR